MLDFFTVYVDRVHNKKEEDHLFPLIEARGIPRSGGPLAVMLQEHEQGRSLLARVKAVADDFLLGDREQLPALRAAFGPTPSCSRTTSGRRTTSSTRWRSRS